MCDSDDDESQISDKDEAPSYKFTAHYYVYCRSVRDYHKLVLVGVWRPYYIVI